MNYRINIFFFIVSKIENQSQDLNKLYILSYQITHIHKFTYTIIYFNHTLLCVYSMGNLNECWPRAPMLGSRPAFGMIFHDRVNVTLL